MDSSVAAVLVHKAVGKQLICVFVDHGLLRKDEGDQVEQVFKRDFDMNLIRVNAQDRFLSKLKGVSDPEKKRKIIGEEFIRVFEEESKKIGHVDFLVQGTIYPDVVESGGTGTSATIKSHHNVGGLPKDMKLGLIEPLRELFKDEVRAVGEELGIPPNWYGASPSRAPAWPSVFWAKSPKRSCTLCGKPMPSSGKKSPRPVWIGPSGSILPACPTSAVWVSWAISGPTATPSLSVP